MSEVSLENLLLVGKIIRPHGLKGLLRVWTHSQSGESFHGGGAIFLKADPEEIHEKRVVSVAPHKNVFLLELDGLNSIKDAEQYRGAQIYVRKDKLRRTSDNEYFWFELIGLQVYKDTGLYLGTIMDILETGSNDIYVVREGETELMIPAIHDVVKEIDIENKRMIITEMEGLFNINEV